MLPMGSSTALAAQAGTLAAGREITVRVTPTAARPNDAWGYISGAWNQLRGRPASAGPTGNTRPAPAGPDAASTRRQSLPSSRRRPAEDGSTPGGAPRDCRTAGPWSTDPRWQAYLQQCSAIKGLISACVFDFRAERALAHVGSRPGPDRLVAQGATLFAAMAE